MKRTFEICDRCRAPKEEETLTKEIKLSTVNMIKQNAEVAFTNSFTDLDLCNQCYCDLIHWFGKINPFTNSYFQPPSIKVEKKVEKGEIIRGELIKD